MAKITRRSQLGMIGLTPWGAAFVAGFGGTDPEGKTAEARQRVHSGAVRELIVLPGRLVGRVEDRPAAVGCPTLPEEMFRGLEARLATLPRALARLLRGELASELDEAFFGDYPLVPGPGELGFECACPDPAPPCLHALALLYEFARLYDSDPWLLFALRGRGRETLLAGVRHALTMRTDYAALAAWHAPRGARRTLDPRAAHWDGAPAERPEARPEPSRPPPDWPATLPEALGGAELLAWLRAHARGGKDP